MRRKTCLSLQLMLAAALVVVDSNDFANNLLNCSRKNEFDHCLKQTLADLRGLMRVGIPELGIGPSEPFRVDNIAFKSRPGLGVRVDAKFSEVIVEGLSKFVTRNISADLERRELSMEIYVPKVNITGVYDIEGKVLVFGLQGHGRFDTALTGAVGKGSGRIVQVRSPDGEDRFTIQDTTIDFDIEGARVKLDNLFNGKFEALASVVNEYINSNSDEIIQEVKPQIRDEVSSLVQSVMNDAFSKLPVKEFLDEFPAQQVPRKLRPLLWQ